MTLQELNQVSKSEAEAALFRCCGSRTWIAGMEKSRPFASEEKLFERATEVWQTCTSDDWLEAFRQHPRIGEKAGEKKGTDWSKQEQSGMNAATDAVKKELEDLNRSYDKKFGFVFLICATGKSAAEMLQSLKTRLQNDRKTELAIAAKEQDKITKIRLEKLLRS